MDGRTGSEGAAVVAEPVQPVDLLETAVAVVRPAAEQARRLRARGLGQVDTKSTDTDVVTTADRQVERAMVDALRRLRPGDTVLGEEYGAAGGPVGHGQVRWVLDPIDGTVTYLYGLPWYAVSLAAEVDGEVVAGVVHNAATGQEWTAAAGHGAWCDGVRMQGSVQDKLGQALVGTGFGYDPARRAHQAAVVAGLIDQVRDIRRIGSAALDLCLAAQGVLDAYFEQGLSRWDYAAGALIASEAGLHVAGLHGAAAGPDLLIAAPAALFGPLHDHLVRLDAAGGP
jgi:myo-inositol-1(or 4)-monophosphatase